MRFELSTVIVAAALVLGGAVAAWGLRGDRSRGRKRCGRCWYDMSAAVGLRCTECGWESRDEHGLYRTRKRWGGVAAGVLIAAVGAFTARMVTDAGWAGMTPTWALIRLLPPADSADVDLSAWPPAPTDWASKEMKRRFDAGLLTGGEVRAAFERQGVVRTLPRWPVGSRMHVSIKPVAWIGEYHTLVVDEDDSQDATDQWMPVSTSMDAIPIARARMGRNEASVRVRLVGAAAQVDIDCDASYEGVATLTPKPDASDAATRTIASLLQVGGARGVSLREMLVFSVRRTLATERMGVEILVEIDGGEGWTEDLLGVNGARFSPRGADESSSAAGIGRVADCCRLWLSAPEQDGWKVRLRGVPPTDGDAWPAETYWAGELVFTVGELRAMEGR